MRSKKISEIELNESFDVWMKPGGRYRIFVQSSLKAQILNRFLDYPYGKDADFVQSSSEAIFNFDGRKLDGVLNILKS